MTGTYEADNIIDNFVVRESTMTAFVSDDPYSGENKTLEPPTNSISLQKTVPIVHLRSRILTRYPKQPNDQLLHPQA